MIKRRLVSMIITVTMAVSSLQFSYINVQAADLEEDLEIAALAAEEASEESSEEIFAEETEVQEEVSEELNTEEISVEETAVPEPETEEETLLDASYKGLVLNAGEGTFKDGTKEISFDSYQEESLTNYVLNNAYYPVREGYAFRGWAHLDERDVTSYNSQKEKYYLHHDASVHPGTTLYPKWSPTRKYMVVLDKDNDLSNGGGYVMVDGEKKTQIVVYVAGDECLKQGQNYDLIRNMSYNAEHTDTSYYFAGFYRQAGVNNQNIYDSDPDFTIVDGNSYVYDDTTVYAGFKENGCAVTLHDSTGGYFKHSSNKDQYEGRNTTYIYRLGPSYYICARSSLEEVCLNDDATVAFLGLYYDSAFTNPVTEEELNIGQMYVYGLLDEHDNLDLYVRWGNEVPMITFDPNGGVYVDNKESEGDGDYDLSSEPIVIAQRPNLSFDKMPINLSDRHKTFTGWYSDASCSAASKVSDEYGYIYFHNGNGTWFTQSTTLYAGWESTRTVITFSAPEGCTFNGYDADLKENITSDKIIVTINKDGNRTLAYGNGRVNEVVYTDKHKSFDKWSYNGKNYEDDVLNGMTFTKDTTITPVSKECVYVKVDFGGEIATDNDNEYSIYEEKLNKNDKFSNLVWFVHNKDNTKYIEGYYHDSEYKSPLPQNALVGQYVVTKDETIYAKWADYYTVTFDMGPLSIDGSHTIEKTHIKKGETLDYCPKGTPISRDKRSSFKGWLMDGKSITPDEIKALTVNKRFTIKADYDEMVFITFDVNTSNTAAKVTYNLNWVNDQYGVIAVRKGYNLQGYEFPGASYWQNNITDAEDPTEDYRTFEGWFLDKACTLPLDRSSYIADEDATFYAKWAADTFYTITFVNTRTNLGEMQLGDAELLFRYDSVNVYVPKGAPYAFNGVDVGDGFEFPHININEENRDTQQAFHTGEWSTNADGSGQRWFLDGSRGYFIDEDGTKHSFKPEEFIPTRDMTFYTVWDEAITVTLNLNGGQCGYDDGYHFIDNPFVFHKASNTLTGRFPKGSTYSEIKKYIPEYLYLTKGEVHWGYKESSCKTLFNDSDILTEDTAIYAAFGTKKNVAITFLSGDEGYYSKTGTGQYERINNSKVYEAYVPAGGIYRTEMDIPFIDDDHKAFFGMYELLGDGYAADLSKPCPYTVYEDGKWYLELTDRKPDKVYMAAYADASIITVDAGEYGNFNDNESARNRVKEKVAAGRYINLSKYEQNIETNGGAWPLGWYYRDGNGVEHKLIVTWSKNGKALYKPTGDIDIYYKWATGSAARNITNIDVSANSGLELKIGEQKTLLSVVTPSDINADVTWFLDDYTCGSGNAAKECPVMLKNDGTIIGKAEGTARVYAIADGKRSDEVTVTVSDEEAEKSLVLKVDGSAASDDAYGLYKGDSLSLAADITPEWLETELVWSCTDTEIVKLTGSRASATATAGSKAGKATVTVKTKDGKLSKSISVNVSIPISFDTHDTVLAAIEGNTLSIISTVMQGYTASYELTDDAGNSVTDLVKMEVKSGGEIVLTPLKFELAREYNLILKGSATINGKTYTDECSILLSSAKGAEAPYCTPFVENGGELTVEKGTRVRLDCSSPGVTIKYSVNGGEYSVYSGPIVITKDTVIRAFAESEKLSRSATVTYNFMLDQDWGEISESIRSDVFAGNISEVPADLWFAIRQEADNKYARIDNVDTDASHTGKNAKLGKLTGQSFLYTGSKIIFNDRINVFYGKSRLIEGRDYTVSYANNTAAAAETSAKAPTFTVKGKGNYASTINFKFGITEADIEDTEITSEKTVAIAASSKLSAVKPTVSFNGKKLSLNKDYVLKYYKTEVGSANLITDAQLKTLKAEENQTYVIQIADKEGGNFAKGPKTETVLVKTYSASNKAYVQASKLKVRDASGKAVKLAYAKDTTYTADKLFGAEGGNAPLICVYNGKTALTYNKDFTVELVGKDTRHNAAGKHSFVIKGISKSESDLSEGEVIVVGNKTATYEIVGTPMKSVKIAGLSTSVEYTGKEISLTDLFNSNDKNLEEAWKTTGEAVLYTVDKSKVKHALTKETVNPDNADYAVSMENTGNVGKFNLVFTGKNGYSGSIKKTITVKAYNLKNDTKNKLTVTIGDNEVYYSKGGAKCKDVTVKFGDSVILREGIDYTLSYKNNGKVADAEIAGAKAPVLIVKGKGNFAGAGTAVKFSIKKAPFDKGHISFAANDVKFNAGGKAGYFIQTPKFTDSGKAIAIGKDKDIEALAKIDYRYYYVGTAAMTDGNVKSDGEEVDPSDKPAAGTIIGIAVSPVCSEKSSYYSAGALECSYRIIDASKDISGAKVTVKDVSGLGFNNGMEVIPISEKDLKVTLQGKELDPGDYRIVSVSDNRFIGTATVTLEGTGEYGGKKTFKFRITARGLS